MKIRKGKRGQFEGPLHARKRIGTRDGKAVLRLEGRRKDFEDIPDKGDAYRRPGRAY